MSFREFCQLCERVRATNSKNEKIAIMADYLTRLEGERLAISARFLSGRVFPKGSPLEVNIGYRLLFGLLMDVTGLSSWELLEIYRRHGDLGETAEEALSRRRAITTLLQKDRRLDIVDLHRRLESVAKMVGEGSTRRRLDRLRALLIVCSPLEVKYLYKLLLSELRIGVVEGMVEQAVATAFNRDLEEIRRARLLVGDIGEVAVMAKEGRLNEARITPLKPLEFMLAEPMPSAGEIERYFRRPLLSEYKYDGIRAQLHKASNEVRIFSRRLEDITQSFPEIVDAARRIPHDFVLDGEILAFKDERPLPFHQLQHRLRRRDPREVASEIPVVYLTYDIMYLDGKQLIDRRLEERKHLLESLGLREPILSVPYRVVSSAEEIESMFEESRTEGYEGLMLKDPNSQYEVGRRGKRWVKLKEELDTIDAVVVAAEYGHGKRAGLLSDLIFALRDGNELKIVGKAYTGLTDLEIRWLTEKLREIAVREEGLRVWVRPEVVVEVAFDSVQRSDRHEGGYALRFPRIKRLRLDKSLEDVDSVEKLKILSPSELPQGRP